jgi:hypothetical protein
LQRHALNLATAASLVLCLATGALWARSHAWSERFSFVGRERGSMFVASDGDFGIYRSDLISSSRTGFFHEAGATWPLRGAYQWQLGNSPAERQWGPFTIYAMTPPPAPPAQQVADAEMATRAWREVEDAPPPGDRPGLVRRSRLRAAAARAHSVLHPDTGWGVVLPAWLPFSITALLLAARLVPAWRRLRRRELARAGRCVGCGYDLRASPHRCPECGTERVASARPA